MDPGVSDKVAALKEVGYAIFPDLLTGAQVSLFRNHALLDRRPGDLYVLGSKLIAIHPEVVLPAVASARVLDTAERVMGPFVQLDSFSLVGVAKECSAGIDWHRDPYGSAPRGTGFQRPLAMNLLIYLQDMNDLSGPLRIIPGSHREPLTLSNAERNQSHAQEQLIQLRTGDGVLIHNNLVHSRSVNRSTEDRLHVSVIYSLSCMRPSIDLNSDGALRLIAALKGHGSKRLCRLFGLDTQAMGRYNSGFMEDDEKAWERWISEDETS